MKGDFGRSTFRKEKHYVKVYKQQGRLSLDSDWNEQAEINSYFQRNSSKDIIGYSGTPIKDAGFKITPIFTETSLVAPGPNYTISGGRYFVNGILCENEKNVTAKIQPDLVTANDDDNPALPKEPGTHLVYLDVWERHITSLEDEQIREVALGGADTTTRAKIVWQVKTKRIGNTDANINCLSELDFWNNLTTRQPNATMTARVSSINMDDDPCRLPPDAKYKGLENQLYRIEVHDPGNATKDLAVKWSRNNGFVTTKIESTEGNTITIQNLGKDKLLGFEVGDWVEVIDDEKELLGKPGIIARITDIDDLKIELDPDSIIDDDNIQNNFPISARPKIRKWDMKEGLLKIPNNRRSDSDTTEDTFWFEIEDGIEIKLGLGQFRTEDYWLIPARTATHDIEWPREGEVSISQPPLGITHHYARLGIIKFDGTKIDTNIVDCRRIFPDLTSLSNLHYVGGDGQVGKKNTSLLLPLQVGASNGQYPLEGITIEFEVKNGGGSINPIKTRTNSDGIARCTWTLGETEPQQVIAVMKNERGQKVHLPVWFNAAITKDGKTGNCTISIGPNDVADGGTSLTNRIQELQKLNGGKICLSAGQYLLSDTITTNQLNNITIEGTGNATKLIVTNKESAFHFVKSNNIHIDKVQIISTNPSNKTINQPGLNGVITFTDCNGIKITQCKLKTAYGFSPTRSCLAIYGNDKSPSSKININNCEFEIGSMQIGILATNVADLTIANNHMTTMPARGSIISIGKTALFKNNHILKLLVNRLGSRGLSIETFTKANDLEVELANKIKTGIVQYREGKHDEALKTMNNAKKIGDEIDEIVKKGETISKPFIENEIFTIFGRAKLERTNVKSLIIDGITHASKGKHDEAKKVWELASTKEDSVNELTKIGVSLSKRSIDENKIKTDLSKNQDLVYAAATWNFDKTRFNANELKIIRGIRQDISIAYQGIVIGGTRAEKIRIQNNIIKRIMQGIHVGVSNNIKATKNQNIHMAKNISISNNIIEVEFWNTFPKQKHGIFVGNADVVYLQDNQLIFKETNHSAIKSQAGPASDGIRIFGYQGSMLRIIGNSITGARTGVYLTILGYPPNYSSTYGLWVLRENVVTEHTLWPFYLTGKNNALKNNIRFTGRDNIPELAGPPAFAVWHII